jgi:bifunctional UDP-N-acetylglucosamine pyrophosphorylase/glucosamine-1-phosphate N-acetyltransferase
LTVSRAKQISLQWQRPVKQEKKVATKKAVAKKPATKQVTNKKPAVKKVAVKKSTKGKK